MIEAEQTMTQIRPVVMGDRHAPAPDRIGEILDAVQMPLENMEFTIERYLLENGPRLDTETRVLLAGLRDRIGEVAVSTRRIIVAPPEEG